MHPAGLSPRGPFSAGRRRVQSAVMRATAVCTSLVLVLAARLQCLPRRQAPEVERPRPVSPAPRPAPGAFRACAFSEMQHLTADTPLEDDLSIFSKNDRAVRLFGGANETLSFQLVAEAGGQAVPDLRLSFSDVRGAGGLRIEADNIRAFRMLAVAVPDFPPWYLRLEGPPPGPLTVYDPLIPLDAPKGGQPYDLSPGKRLAFWIDVHVPRGTRPGDYTARVQIASASRPIWQVDLAVKVYDFVLPDAAALPVVGSFDHHDLYRWFVRRDGRPYLPAQLDRDNPLTRPGLVVMRQLIRLAREHRVDLFDRRICPVLKRADDGKVTLDWADYEAIVGPYVTGAAFDDRIGSAAWPLPVRDDWPDPANYGGMDSPSYAATIAQVLAECRRKFADLDAAGRSFIWPVRGRVDQAAYEPFATFARIARAADPDTPILTQLPPNPPKATGWRVPDDFGRLAQIVAPQGQWLDAGPTARAETPGGSLAGVWLSAGQVPYVPALGIIATPADVRAFAWFAMKYRCRGVFLPEVLHWPEDEYSQPPLVQARLFYPGTVVGMQAVVPSVRLKRLRRGLQDLAYLWVLRRRQRADRAEAILHAMVRYAGLDAAGDNYLDPRLHGWVREPAAWQLAHKLLAEEVLAAVHDEEGGEQPPLARRLDWMRLAEQTRRLRVEQVRSRVAAGQARKLRATVLLDLANEFDQEVAAIGRLGDLPPGWQALAGEVAVTFPPRSRRVVELSAEGEKPALGSNAKMVLPVSITGGDRQGRTIAAEVTFVRARRTDRPPVIDGKLDEWQLGPTRIATGFRLIGRRGETPQGLAKRQTHVFMLYDDRALYIAFRCEEPQPAGMVVRADNIVRYDQLLAQGEDLVEIILDPGAGGDGPEDIYHMVVKPNGILVAERGVGTDPPLGAAQPWPAGATVAAAVMPDRHVWIIELAVPRSAFGARADARFWGANFARFAPQGHEASSWAHAPRYLYHPRSLGTLYLAPPAKADLSAPTAHRKD